MAYRPLEEDLGKNGSWRAAPEGSLEKARRAERYRKAAARNAWDISLISGSNPVAEGLRRDQAAVQMALEDRWSNGPVEGHINRLKTIKRQMYGRASLPLLRARVQSAG
jgi:transposase